MRADFSCGTAKKLTHHKASNFLRKEREMDTGNQDGQENVKGLETTKKRKGKEERDPIPEVLVPVKETGLDAKVSDGATSVTEILSDKPIEKKTSDFSSIVAIQEYVNALQVNLRSNRQLVLDEGRDILPLSNVRLELPQEINSVKPFIFFQYGTDFEWCVMKVRWSSARTSFSDYKSWLVRFRHCLEELTKQGYCYYRLKDKESWDGIRTLKYTDVGIDASINAGSTDEVARAFVDLRRKLVPTASRDMRYEMINVCCPKSVSEVWSRMQSFIFDDVSKSKEWMTRFCDRKLLRHDFGTGMREGDTNVQWIKSAAPWNLPMFLNILPNMNMISLVYSLFFVSPKVEFSKVNLTAIFQDLNLSTSRVDGITQFINMVSTEQDDKELAGLIMAWMFPGQVRVRYVPKVDDSKVLQAIGALCAKMLLSYSPGCRNITTNSAHDADLQLRQYLSYCGVYLDARCGTPKNQNNVAGLLESLMTTDAGGGWLNMGVESLHTIRDPLYWGINRLPQYGGINYYRDPSAHYIDNGDETPPIRKRISDFLRGLSRLSGRNTGSAGHIERVLSYLEQSWRGSLSVINEHIKRTGECGFRLPTEKVFKMDKDELDYDNSDVSLEKPLIVDVSAKTMMVAMKSMPSTLFPSSHISEQPMIESVVSAELQRLYSLILITNDRVAVDGRKYELPKSQVISTVLGGTISNHFSKKILERSLSNDYIKSFSIPKLRSLSASFDDFEAKFYADSAKVVIDEPELFGMTRNVVQKLQYVPIINKEMYLERRRNGIIADNSIEIPYVEANLMTYQDMVAHLAGFSLLSTLRDPTRGLEGKIILPIWMEYEEECVEVWEPENPAYTINIPPTRLAIGGGESIEFGGFKRNFLLARPNKSYMPDACLLGSSARKFWYCGDNSYTMPFSSVQLANLLNHQVRSWFGYMRVENIFQVLDEALGRRT